jgi:DNA repair protein RecN (Recombination protein N)
MLRRLYIKELILFDEVELNFDRGLIVFSGASGAGKSILIHQILANFGLGSSEARVCEVELDKPKGLELDDFELESILSIKALKKERVRLYLNNQNISKKRLKEMFDSHIHYLSVRDERGFESQKLISIIDLFISKKNSFYQERLKEYKSRFEIYKKRLFELNRIEDDQKRALELIEFIRFEIDKISSIDPKPKEYEKLLEIKHQLSKIDKIQEALLRANAIFELEDDVNEVFNLLGRDGSYFNETMNQLRVDFDEVQELTLELADIDVEDILERLEKLSSLINRYGSIQKALEYRDKKLIELQELERIRYSKKELMEFVEFEKEKLSKMAQEISSLRKDEAKSIAKALNEQLKKLKLPDAKFIFRSVEIYDLGADEVDLELEGSSISTLSGGEFNRLRLALMSLEARLLSTQDSVIFLDEMDANVSGDESIAIANMVEELSKKFQVFAISHQPHLSSKASEHILISRDGGRSRVRVLDFEERVDEIARMISGQESDKEALAFAKKLFAKTEEDR